MLKEEIEKHFGELQKKLKRDLHEMKREAEELEVQFQEVFKDGN